MTGDDIKADVQSKLVDAGIRWDDPFLLAAINEAGRDIATIKPKATTLRANIQLTPNVTKQANPAGAIAVLDLFANMGVAGITPGRGITTIAEERLRAARASWRADKGAEVKHLVQDDRDPGFFNVWPAPTTALYVEALLHKVYAPIANLGDALPLDDSYRNPLGDYVMYCAYAMEGEQQNIAAASGYYAKYAQTMGVQIQKQKRASAPANGPENPTQPAVDKNGA